MSKIKLVKLLKNKMEMKIRKQNKTKMLNKTQIHKIM